MTIYLGHQDGLPIKVAEAWWGKNNKLFRVYDVYNPLENSDEWKVFGYHLILPINNKTANKLQNDEIHDIEISENDIANEHSDTVETLYIMDLMMIRYSDFNKHAFRYRASSGHMIRDIILTVQDALERYPNVKELISLTATKEGMNLVTRYGFTQDKNYQSDTGWKFWVANASDFSMTQFESKYRYIRGKTFEPISVI